MLYGPPVIKPVTAENTIFAFDLHKVIVHRDWAAIGKYFLKMLCDFSLFKYFVNPIFWWRVWSFWQQTTVGDEIFDKIVRFYPELEKYQADFIALENMQVPDEKMLSLVQDLKNRGIRLYLLSNIGARAYADFSLKRSNVTSLFDHVFLPSIDRNYCQKPDALFYDDFILFTKVCSDDGKQIIFVDDRKYNLEAAAKRGIIGIYYVNAKELLKIICLITAVR